MKIGIQTWGSEGDIRPFVALAGGLAGAGHEVRLLYTSVENRDYSVYAERYGFESERVCHYDITREMVTSFNEMFLMSKDPLTVLMFILDNFLYPKVGEMYEAAKGLADGSDLVIGHFCMHPTHLAAEKAGKPYVTVTLNHGGLETSYAPPMGFPNLGRIFNRLIWKLGMKVLARRFTPPVNELRAAEGFSPVRDFREVWESRLLNLLAVSPALCEARPDWPESCRVCGFLAVEEGGEAEEMPDGLEEFMAAGYPPVFIGFGSMTVIDPGTDYIPETVGIMVEAARLAGVRAIIQAPWSSGTLAGMDTPVDVFRAEKVPHSRVYPLCSAIVHHGGAGTTHTAARSGRPSFAVAHLADQALWGETLYRKGAAPKPVFRRDLTPKILAAAIREMLDSETMAKNAAEIRRSMKDENGVARAVELIGSHGV